VLADLSSRATIELSLGSAFLGAVIGASASGWFQGRNSLRQRRLAAYAQFLGAAGAMVEHAVRAHEDQLDPHIMEDSTAVGQAIAAITLVGTEATMNASSQVQTRAIAFVDAKRAAWTRRI